MRRFRARERSLLALISLLFPSISTATPLALSLADTELIDSQNVTIAARGGCQNPCGYEGWLCCGESQKCFTDYNNRASCSNYAGTMSQAPGGYWTTYTSTWIETNQITHTSCWSSFITPIVATTTSSWYPPSGTAAVAYCNTAKGESSCGNICCASYQYCAVAGQCAAAATSSPYSAPVRPTSSGAVIFTATITTATVPFETPVGTAQAATVTAVPGAFTPSDDGGGLSGGAIAGIVIGVILAVLFLILLLLFLCFRSAWHALLALFGLGRRKKRRTEVEYSEYRRHGSRTASRRYYDDGRRVEYDPREEKKKKSGLGWGTVAAGLGALGLAFGLKKRHDRKKREEEKSDYSSSYDYTTSYGYTDSESSGRRTYSTRRQSRSRR